MHVIHFTVNICTCSEKVKYELKKNKISQLFKANFFCFFHTRHAKDRGYVRNILLCIFHSRRPGTRAGVPAGGETACIFGGADFFSGPQRVRFAVCVQLRISHEELFSYSSFTSSAFSSRRKRRMPSPRGISPSRNARPTGSGLSSQIPRAASTGRKPRIEAKQWCRMCELHA